MFTYPRLQSVLTQISWSRILEASLSYAANSSKHGRSTKARGRGYDVWKNRATLFRYVHTVISLVMRSRLAAFGSSMLERTPTRCPLSTARVFHASSNLK
jgi:hypothetical protein